MKSTKISNFCHYCVLWIYYFFLAANYFEKWNFIPISLMLNFTFLRSIILLKLLFNYLVICIHKYHSLSWWNCFMFLKFIAFVSESCRYQHLEKKNTVKTVIHYRYVDLCSKKSYITVFGVPKLKFKMHEFFFYCHLYVCGKRKLNVNLKPLILKYNLKPNNSCRQSHIYSTLQQQVAVMVDTVAANLCTTYK